jgi:threonyl-tRNA synthetase
MIVNVTNTVDDYANKVYEKLKLFGFRVEIDLENNQLSYKLKKYSKLKIPVICIIGVDEKEKEEIAFRFFGANDTIKVPLNDAEKVLKEKFILSNK